MKKLDNLNFAALAEEAIKGLQFEDKRGDKRIRITTSKIRNLLSMSNNIYSEIMKKREEKLDEETRSNIQYTKMKYAYEAGREADVKEFIRKTNIMEYIDDIGDSRDKALLFCKYMESLIAYHKFYGGSER